MEISADKKNTLQVKMFGSFSVYYEGQLIPFEKHVSAKFLQLFQILLLNVGSKVSKSSLVQELYGREEVENSNGSLNNTIFRLRKFLENSSLPKDQYVIVQDGYCCWSGNVKVEMDVKEFESLVLQARKEEDAMEKVRIYTKACDAYKGEFLPQMANEEWVIVANVHFQELYFEALRFLCDVLKEQRNYSEIYRLTSDAASYYPYEEWVIWRIDSLIAMGRYKEAMQVYAETTKYFFEDLGLPPSEQMLSRFKMISNQIQLASNSLADIKTGLKEEVRLRGAYFCSFPSFVDSYRVISRAMERTGQSTFLMLCTLLDSQGFPVEKAEKRKDMSEKFEEALKISLRRGDLYTRYNGCQYLILLLGTNQENCGIVSDRIERNFRDLGGGRGKISYYVTSIADIDKEDYGQLKFGSSAWT